MENLPEILPQKATELIRENEPYVKKAVYRVMCNA